MQIWNLEAKPNNTVTIQCTVLVTVVDYHTLAHVPRINRTLAMLAIANDTVTDTFWESGWPVHTMHHPFKFCINNNY